MVKEQEKSTPAIYEIRIKGHLSDRWADWFEGMAFTHESDGTTTLRGPLTDQAALHGLLNGIRDLGLPLISVQLQSACPLSALSWDFCRMWPPSTPT